MNKKIILILPLALVFISIISAATNPCGSGNSFLGTFKQGEVVNLKQICDTCSFVNVTRIDYPDSSFTSDERIMTRDGINYNQTFTDTFKLGCYTYDTKGDKDGVANTTEVIDFQISAGGGLNNLGFVIIIIVVVYGLSLTGFFLGNEIITLLGSLPMFILGIFVVSNGIAGFRETITLAIGLVSIGLGAYLSYESTFSLYQDL